MFKLKLMVSPLTLSLDNHQFTMFLTSFTYGGEFSDDNFNVLRINEIKQSDDGIYQCVTSVEMLAIT